MENHRRVLEFEVDKQRLHKKSGCDFKGLVAGSKNYLIAKFYLSRDEWDECRVAASFWINGEEHPVILDQDNACVIPPEVLTGRTFRCSLTGMRNDYIIKTNRIAVRQEVS